MKKFNNFSKKIVLGTAQLCEKYGYFNKSNTNNKKAIKILETRQPKKEQQGQKEFQQRPKPQKKVRLIPKNVSSIF